jgi:hypothetical protein
LKNRRYDEECKIAIEQMKKANMVNKRKKRERRAGVTH